jgi:hypothetical protein
MRFEPFQNLGEALAWGLADAMVSAMGNTAASLFGWAGTPGSSTPGWQLLGSIASPHLPPHLKLFSPPELFARLQHKIARLPGQTKKEGETAVRQAFVSQAFILLCYHFRQGNIKLESLLLSDASFLSGSRLVSLFCHFGQ